MPRIGRAFPCHPLIQQFAKQVIVHNFTQTLSETVTDTDTLARLESRTLTETVTDTDVLSASRVTVSTLTETLVDTDTLSRVESRTLTETVTDTDTLKRLESRTLTEALTDTDTISASFTIKILTESQVFVDSILAVAPYHTTWVQETIASSSTWVPETIPV